MNGNAEFYVALPYLLKIEQDTAGGKVCFVASHPELPGCMAFGPTPQEAVDELGDARRLYIESMLDDDMTPPIPRDLHGQFVFEVLPRVVHSGPTQPDGQSCSFENLQKVG